MTKKTSSFERYVIYTLYMVILILAIVVIASVFDTVIRFLPDTEIIGSEEEVFGNLDRDDKGITRPVWGWDYGLQGYPGWSGWRYSKGGSSSEGESEKKTYNKR